MGDEARRFQLTEAQGFTAFAMCAVRANGVVTPEEVAGMATTLARVRFYEGWSEARIIGFLNELSEAFRKEGVEVVLKAAAGALRPDLRPTAYAVAVDLIMADHIVDDLEEIALSKMKEHLGLRDEDARRIYDVMAIKNRAG
jgi:hypothetical protein